MTDVLDTRAGFSHFERVAVPSWASGAGSAPYLACCDAALAVLLDGAVPGSSVVDVHCRMHRSAAAGDALDAGLRVMDLGTASVRFEVGLFHPGEDKPAASACLALVLVDGQSGKPAPMAPALRKRLDALRG